METGLWVPRSSRTGTDTDSGTAPISVGLYIHVNIPGKGAGNQRPPSHPHRALSGKKRRQRHRRARMVPNLTLEAACSDPQQCTSITPYASGVAVCVVGGILQANQSASERRGASRLYGAELEQNTV